MSDIEDQLLELAGGDSSDDEQPMEMSREDSRSPSPSAHAPKEKRDTPARNTPAKKTPAKKASRRARSDDESEDEGQASSVPASPDSQQSVAMDESDSDDELVQNKSRGEDEGNQYPFEGLFRDADEKEYIMSLREIEREQILAERREENERIRQNRMLRQLKVNQDKDNKKRKASAADLEEAQRKPARVRGKAGETSDKMDSLRRAREERSSRKEQRERENDRRKQRSPSYRRSPGRDDDDSEVEWERDRDRDRTKHRTRSPDIKESPPAELRDIDRARVGRTAFGQVCYTPGFEKALIGCFVRLNIGPHPETRQVVYRMGLIKGFTQGAAYAMPGSASVQIVVETYAVVAHGKAEKEYPFIFCSDSNFTESEFNRYKAVCAHENVPLPTKEAVRKKLDDINKLIAHVWTEAELSAKFKKQDALRTKYSGFERDNLKRQIEAAQRKGDAELEAKLRERLDNLDVPKLAFRTSLTPQQKDVAKPPSQQERLAQLNAQNRKINAEEIRKAQRLERQRARENDEQERAKNNAAPPVLVVAADGTTLTPFQRARRTQYEYIQKHRTISKPIFSWPISYDDIINEMDMDLEIDIDLDDI